MSASLVREPAQTSSKSGQRSKSPAPKRGSKSAEPAPAPAPETPKPADPAPPVTPPAAAPVTPPAPAASTTDSWLLLIAGVLAVAGGLQWWTMRQLGRHVREGLAQTKEAADGAATSAAAAARALAASERAYLVARNWGMRPPAAGEIPEVDFIVENVGRTPARRTLVRGQIEVRDTPLPAVPKWRAAEASGGTLTIPPGGRPASTLAGDAPLTREEMERLRSATAFLSIWGRVDYEDVLGAAQSVNFAWRFDMATGALTYDTASEAYHEAT